MYQSPRIRSKSLKRIKMVSSVAESLACARVHPNIWISDAWSLYRHEEEYLTLGFSNAILPPYSPCHVMIFLLRLDIHNELFPAHRFPKYAPKRYCKAKSFFHGIKRLLFLVRVLGLEVPGRRPEIPLWRRNLQVLRSAGYRGEGVWKSWEPFELNFPVFLTGGWLKYIAFISSQWVCQTCVTVFSIYGTAILRSKLQYNKSRCVAHLLQRLLHKWRGIIWGLNPYNSQPSRWRLLLRERKKNGSGCLKEVVET